MGFKFLKLKFVIFGPFSVLANFSIFLHFCIFWPKTAKINQILSAKKIVQKCPKLGICDVYPKTLFFLYRKIGQKNHKNLGFKFWKLKFVIFVNFSVLANFSIFLHFYIFWQKIAKINQILSAKKIIQKMPKTRHLWCIS